MSVKGSLIKLAVFAVVTTFLTAILAVTISNMSFQPERTYKADFTDVTGLLPGDEVRIAGVKVGNVKNITVKRVGDGTLAEVTFSVVKSATLRTTSLARLRFRDLVGRRYVTLAEGDPTGGPLKPGGVIPASQTQGALDLTVLFNGFKPLFKALSPSDVNQLASEIIRTLQGEGGTMDMLLARTASLTNTLADRDQVIGEVIDNLNTVLATVDQRDQGLSQLILQMQRLVSGLAEDRNAIADSLGNIDSVTAATAGLLQDARPPLADDIRRLGVISNTLKNHNALIDHDLKRLPVTLAAVARTGSYGTWFNQYVCDMEGTVTFNGTPYGFSQPPNPDPACK